MVKISHRNTQYHANLTYGNLKSTQISGTIMVAAAFQILIGATGMMEGILRYVGPITVTPIITLIGIALFQTAADMCASQWGISLL